MALDHKDNNFDTLRLTAAAMVLVSHSFPLAYGSNDAGEPLWKLSHNQATLGTLSVWVFFIISGYLITQSFAKAPDPGRYLSARCLRIFPGLLVSLIFCATVLGPLT